MQKLRTTFKRSRTPTGAEMKTQSSLEVSKQVRSASFDEIQLEAQRLQQTRTPSTELLDVPQFPGQRSKSVDSDESGVFLEVPRRFPRRRSSGAKSPVCVHCVCSEKYYKQHPPEEVPPDPPDWSDSSSEEDTSNPIRITLMPTIECTFVDVTTRRKSIHRQEAFVAEPSGNSLENMSDTLSEGEAVKDIYLQVPDLKRDRAASVDSCFSKVGQGKTEELQHQGDCLEVPVNSGVALRSRSVDIVLPTDEQARYKALAMAAPSTASSKGRSAGGEREGVLRATPDWGENANNDDHLWVPTSVSGDFCYVGEADCSKHGPRMKCSACNVVVHQNCVTSLTERARFSCKSTFRDVGVRQYREQQSIQHHWVHRRQEKGKCRQCGRSFQSKLSFSSKEIVAISCSWCKAAYHNKDSCFNIQRIGEECSLGVHNSIIVPPSWIVKLPKKGNFKSSLRKTPKKKTSERKKGREKEGKAFVIKPIPTTVARPVIVFINPKSGGNQGTKLLQKFQWLLNPRQVFDLTQGGPKMGLELFKKVHNLRVLACGGDGTAGWVLSVIDQIGISPAPAVGVLPLGTGNDLARALGWGGGYTDEPISKILSNISNSDTVVLDRWKVEVVRNPDGNPSNDGKEKLPLNVVNNYFSMGVDAHIALEFHEAREAHPERFNSRLRNKMFYGQMGGKDLLKRKWKGLADFVTLECDGKDLTPKLKELKVHAIVFLNIPSYGGGTKPWNRSTPGTSEPRTDDGLIEVVGLTTYQLPLLQAGGHGTCIAQCSTARVITSKTIPMQVDGEACKVMPSIITLSLLNKAPMLAKRKCGRLNHQETALLDNLTINVFAITMTDYEQHHYDKDLLAQAATSLGVIDVDPISDLENVRGQINKLREESMEWCFLDSCTAERFFRVDKAQENLHYICDIANSNLYILECGSGTISQQSDDEILPVHCPNPAYVIPEMRVSDEGSLDSPSDQPPMSPENLQSPVEPPPERLQFIESAVNNSALRIKSISERLFGLAQDSCTIYSDRDKEAEALIRAAKVGDLKTIKELHGQGCSLMAKDNLGWSMLHHSAKCGHKELVKYLISYVPTSFLNVKEDRGGQTALHIAAANKWRSICCMLVASGAALDIVDQKGMTARHLAVQSEDHELATYLESQEHFQLVSSDMGTVV